MYSRVVFVFYLDSLVLDSHISLIVVYNHTPIDCFFSIAWSNFYLTISEQQQIKLVWPKQEYTCMYKALLYYYTFGGFQGRGWDCGKEITAPL